MPEQKTISDDFGFGELLSEAIADEPGKPKGMLVIDQRFLDRIDSTNA